MTDRPPTSVGEVAAPVVAQQVAQEYAARDSFDRRIQAMCSTAVTATSITFAGLALLAKADGTVGKDAQTSIVVALIAFGVCAVVSLVAVLPRATKLANTDDLADYVAADRFSDTANVSDARAHIAAQQLETLNSLTGQNGSRARMLTACVILLIVGLGALTVAVTQVDWP